MTTSNLRAPTPEVSESLENLVEVLDKLKSTLGYGDDMQEIENILNQLQDEKAELHRYAEEAILEAQRIRDENEVLVERVHDAEQAALEAKINVVIAENNKLQEIAAEFDRSILEIKLAEAEDAINEAAALRERITELEEENAGLTTTLREIRSSSQQLQALAALESRAVASAAAQAAALGLPSSPTSKLIGSGDTTPREAPSLYATPKPSSLPGGRTAPPAGNPPADEPGATAYISAAGGGEDYVGKDPARLADQLVAATGGAGAATEGGIVSHAAKLLRGYAAIDAELATQRAECERLRGEVDRMQETMSSKTFKAPSAWAEREVKYRQDKKIWEEEKRAMESNMTALRIGGGGGITAGGAALVAGGGGDGDGRLVELEAALLQARREKDGALAQLHELQLSMRVDGEFGKDGVRESPYKGPNAAEALGAAAFADKSVIMGKLEELEGENRKLRGELGAVRPVNLRLAVDGAHRHNNNNSNRGNDKDATQLMALQRDLEKAAVEKTALQAQVHAAKGGVISVEEVETIRQQLVEAECVRDRLAGELHGLKIVASTTDSSTGTFSDDGRIQELTSRLATAETEAARMQSALDDAEQYSQATAAASSAVLLQLNIKDGTAHNKDDAPTTTTTFTTTNHHHPVVAAALFSGEGMSGQLAALNEQLARARVNRQALQEEMSKKTDDIDGDRESNSSQLQVSYDKTRATETKLVAELAVLRQHDKGATTSSSNEDMTAAMSEQLTASRAVYEAMSKQIASLEMKLKQQREETIAAESIVLNITAGGDSTSSDNGELEEAKMQLEEAKHKEQLLLVQLADLRPITLNLAVKDQQQRSQVSAPAAVVAAEDNTVQIAAAAASSALQHQIKALEQQLKRQKASKEGLQEALKQTTAAPFPGSGSKNNTSPGATAALELALAKERLREEILMSRLDNLKDPAVQSQQSSDAAAASLVNTLQGKIAALHSQVAERKRESSVLKAELAEKVQLDNGDRRHNNNSVVVELKMKLEEAKKREAIAVAQLQDLQPVKLHLAVAQAAENAHADTVNISFNLAGDAISGGDGIGGECDQNEAITQSLAAAREVYGSTQKQIDALQGRLTQHCALQAQLKEQTTTKAEIQTQLAVLQQTGASPSDDDAMARLQSELAEVESKEKQLVQEIAALQTVTTTTTSMEAGEVEGGDGEATAQQQEARLSESISSQLVASEMLRTGMQKQVAALKAAMVRAKAVSESNNASPEEAEAAKKKEEVLQARLENLQPVLDELEGLEQSAAATAAAVESSGIKLNINVADSSNNIISAELQEMLAAAEAREADLQSKLREAMATAPVSLRFNLVSGSSDNHHHHHSSAVTAPGGLSRNSSSVSLKYSPEQASQLARDRAAADAEWEEYAKNSDLSALQRTKAELETKVHMLEQKIAEADEDKAVLRQGVEAAIKTGDVNALTSLADRLKAGKSYLGGRISPVSKKLFRRPSSAGKKQPGGEDGGAPSSGGKGNSIKKSFAIKFGSKKPSSTNASPLPIAEEDDLDLHHVSTPMGAFNAAAAGGGGGDEYELLMEHLVATKVRLAESEGDRLESRRALIRAKEKQLEQVKTINELKAALSSVNGGNLSSEFGAGGEDELVGTTGTVKTEHATPGSEKKRGLRIPGIEINLR